MKATNNKIKGMSTQAFAKEGYIKTKLGWIPEEWEILKLSNILKEGKLGGNFENNETFTGLPLIKMGNIGRGRIKLEKVEKVQKSIDFDEEHILKEGDFLFNTRNTLDLVGKVAVWRNEIPKALYNSNLMRMTFDNKKVYSNYFMSYFFNSYNGLRQLKSFAIGTTSVAAIYTRDLIKLTIPLPPLPEQKKITQILSTWDRAIEKYELLIKKYELRKKGLMQQLLSGKKRFREFEGSEWKAAKLGENTICFSGGTPSRNKKEYYNGEIPWIKSGELNHDKIYNTEEFITNEGLNNSSAKIVEEETILVALYGATAGVVAVTMVEAAINQAVLAILPSKIIDNNFLLYKLKFIMPHVVENMVQGGQPNLSGTIVKGVRINIPVKKNEQQKIASVLSTADAEIKILQKQLEKLNEQKRGLMQVLLTGKARVKLN